MDKFFCTLPPYFHWDHFVYFRLLILVIAFAWGRRNVTNLYRYIDATHHRTRFNHFFLVARWDPAAALRQKAQELLRSLRLGTGETIYVVIDDSKKAKRGKAMAAVAKMKDPTTEGYIRGHQYVCALLVVRGQVIPWGIRLYVKPEHAKALDLPFYKTTELAAQLLREFKAPAGLKVMGLFDAYYLCHTVVKACREQHFHFASTLKSNRNLFKQGWKLPAGRYGKNLLRRRRTERCVVAKPQGAVGYRFVDAGWLEMSKLGQLHVVFSRKASARKILGLVTDAPVLSDAERYQPAFVAATIRRVHAVALVARVRDVADITACLQRLKQQVEAVQGRREPSAAMLHQRRTDRSANGCADWPCREQSGAALAAHRPAPWGQTVPRQTLLVKSKTRGTAVLHTTFEGQRDRGHASGETHSHSGGD